MTEDRNIYLKMKSLEAARKILLEAFPTADPPAAETIPVIDAVHRVLAEPVYANLSSPNFHAAAMDGIAVAAAVTFGASETEPKQLTVGQDAHYVNTGHVMPADTDSVIMIENIHPLDDRTLEIAAPAFPWQHVRRMGEDIVATELVFPRYYKITPYCLGALISAGAPRVSVIKKPSVFIQPTGSELVDFRKIPGAGLLPGQVLESNAPMLGAMVLECGCSYVKNDIIEDDFEKITNAVQNAAAGDFDMIFICGGSSAGSHDFTKKVIAELGDVLVHGVTIMPGKPVIIGRINGKPAFGIPGYPVSAIISFEQLVRPLILAMLRQPDVEETEIPVIPTRKLPSKLGIEEFLRVKLGDVGGNIVATPLPRGAGCITSFTEADGIIRIPAHVEGIAENKPVAATLLRPLAHIKNTLVAVGSHDNTLDVIADLIRTKSSRISLSSSHVGSMGGLMAIKKKLAHMAGTHLLSPEDGTYNISYLQKYLPETPLRLVHLVDREQGLIIRRENPKNIRGIEDLARRDVTFINRQAGSGTRVLLDYKLGRLGLDPADIIGYSSEEFTHMAVAVAVLGGTADAGLGIYAAAKALNLDFIPVITESYDLVIPAEEWDTEKIRLLMDIIQSDTFKSRVAALGGYHTETTGKLLWENC